MWWWHVRAFPDSAASHAGGRIRLIGRLTGIEDRVDPRPIMAKRLTVPSLHVGSLEMLERMNTALTPNTMEPVIDSVFPLDAPADA
jgi:NADPH:quinone reductase-like Zn-dependent oxidoreductase